VTSLDALFAECAESDWRVSNLYQSHETSLWRVNLYHRVEGGAEYGDWAEADTLHEALAEAMANMAHREYTADIAPTASQVTMDSIRPSLLTVLGIRPKVQIERRL